MTIPLNERKNNRDSTNECGFVFAAAQMMNRKKTIEYNNDTENYSIEQRTTVNLTKIEYKFVCQFDHIFYRHALVLLWSNITAFPIAMQYQHYTNREIT